MLEEVIEALRRVFDDDERVLVAYIFGSKARGTDMESSDVDIAVLLSSSPENLLDYYLTSTQ
jgi:predicted nucleotidyltransferase